MLHLEFRRRFRFSVQCDRTKVNTPVTVTFYKLDPDYGLVPTATRPGSPEEWAMYEYLTTHDNYPHTEHNHGKAQVRDRG